MKSPPHSVLGISMPSCSLTDVLQGLSGRPGFISDPTVDVERSCRTKITVRVDGDIEKLWQNWTRGLHRYGLSSPNPL